MELPIHDRRFRQHQKQYLVSMRRTSRGGDTPMQFPIHAALLIVALLLDFGHVGGAHYARRRERE